MADAELSTLYFKTWIGQVSGSDDESFTLTALKIDGNFLAFVGGRRHGAASDFTAFIGRFNLDSFSFVNNLVISVSSTRIFFYSNGVVGTKYFAAGMQLVVAQGSLDMVIFVLDSVTLAVEKGIIVDF